MPRGLLRGAYAGPAKTVPQSSLTLTTVQLSSRARSSALITEREVGTFAPHGLCDAPGNRAIAREPDDDGPLAGEEAHQPLCSVTSTRILSRWPGCRYLLPAPLFHSTSLPTETLNRRAIDASESPRRTT
jgi:hypothetical protein